MPLPLETRIIDLLRYSISATKPTFPLCVRFVRFDSPATIATVDCQRVGELQAKVNVYAQGLVDRHGPGILKRNYHRNDALKCLTDEELEWLGDVLKDSQP